MLGRADRVLVQQVRSGAGGQCRGRAGAAESHHGLTGEVGDGVGVGGKGLGNGAGQDDQVGSDAVGGLADGGDGRVRPQVDDAPAPTVQGDAEGDQSDVVLLARQAGQDRGWPAALAPAAGEPEQAASQQVGGKVLLGDRDLPTRPTLAQVVEVGDQQITQDGLDSVGGQSPGAGNASPPAASNS